MAKQRGKLILVGGVPGAGKTTTAQMIAKELPRAATVVDKDALFGPLEIAVMKKHGVIRDSREYDDLKRLQYQAMFKQARINRLGGADVILSAPFSSFARDQSKFDSVIRACGGGTASLLWVVPGSEAQWIEQVTKRNLPRDRDMLARLDEAKARLEPGRMPDVDYTLLVNPGNKKGLQDQVTEYVAILEIDAIHALVETRLHGIGA